MHLSVKQKANWKGSGNICSGDMWKGKDQNELSESVTESRLRKGSVCLHKHVRSRFHMVDGKKESTEPVNNFILMFSITTLIHVKSAV